MSNETFSKYNDNQHAIGVIRRVRVSIAHALSIPLSASHELKHTADVPHTHLNNSHIYEVQELWELTQTRVSCFEINCSI